MTKQVSEETHVKYSDLLEDYESDYVRVIRYLDLDRKDFCCDEIYNHLLGENDGRCELNFSYHPVFREYSIDVRKEFGGAVCLVNFCPWCGTKLPSSLRKEFFDILKKDYNVEVEIRSYEQQVGIPSEFKTDEWWKKRKIN